MAERKQRKNGIPIMAAILIVGGAGAFAYIWCKWRHGEAIIPR